MIPVPIGRFHDQRMGGCRRSRIPDNRKSTASNVTGENQTLCVPILCTVERHGGGAKDMARVDITGTDPGNHIEWLVVGNANHQIHRAHRVAHPVEWLDEVFSPLCQKLGVLLLNVGRVSKHYRREVASR